MSAGVNTSTNNLKEPVRPSPRPSPRSSPRSSPITEQTTNMALLHTDNETENVRTRSEEMVPVFKPSANGSPKCLHKQKNIQSTDESDYVDMTLNRNNVPEIISPYATVPLEGHVYDFIDERKLDQPCQRHDNVTDSGFTPIPPPRPESTLQSAATSPTVSTRAQSPMLIPVENPSLLTTRPSNITFQTFQPIDRPLSPIPIFDHSDTEWEQVNIQSDCCKQIIIQGIPVNMTIKEIGTSFETDILTADDGFEDIKVERTHKEAVVTLKSTRATNELLQRAESGEKFILQGNEVSISPYHQAPTDPMKVFILGLTDGTTDDISNYIENKCGLRPSDVIKGENHEVALLCFDIPPDVSEMRSTLEKQPQEINKWDILPVERTRRVKLRGVAMGTKSEELKQYFEKDQSSKDGVTESIIYRDDFKDYIITFVNIEAAESVVKQKIHTVNDAQLEASLYYPCLDRDEEYLLKIPAPIELHRLNKHMCRFLHISAQYRKDLEEMVNSHHGKVIWPAEKSDDCLCIQCDVDENDKLGKAKVTNWKQSSAGVVSEICKFLSVHYKYFALEILTELKSGIKSMGVSDPESILVSFEENRVAIAGEIKYVDKLSEKIKSMVSSMEQDLDSRGQTITKIVKVEGHEMELFEETNSLERLRNVNSSLENQNIVLKGRRKIVDDSIQKVKDIIESFPKQNIEGITALERSLLRTKETTMYIKRKMNESRITGVWKVLDDGALVMYSKSPEEVKTAITTLKSALKSSRIKVNTKIGIYMLHGVGKSFLEKLEKGYKGRVRLKAYREEVCIVSLDNLLQEINEKVMKYLDSRSDVTEVLPLDPGVFRYILSYKKNVIDAITRQYKSMAVEIDIIDKQTRKGFMISGEKESCKLAIVELHAVVDKVTRTDHDVNWPMFDQFLRSTTGINELNKIELAEKCVITISTNDTKVITEKPRNSLLAECRIGNCKIEILEHDITEKEVEFIVNPTDSAMDHKHGLGRTLVDKGGFSIQKDCSDYVNSAHCLKDGDTFVGNAGCLPCRGIIHVVVPTWSGGNGTEESVLNYVVIKCLLEADKRSCASIALPTIGAGRFGYPSEIIAEMMIKAVKSYLIENGTETFLRRVYICEIDKDMLCLYVRAIEKGFGQTTVMVPEILGGDENDAKEQDAGGKCSKEIEKEIVTGSITSQDTDVIVNSTNVQLKLHIGSLSRSLLKEGGEKIVSELKEKYPHGIHLGDIAVTTGGNLNCKALFHGVLVKWDKGQGYAEMMMRGFVRHCLFTAHKRKYVSVAFPVLGSGALEFPPDWAAEIMLKAIDSFEKDAPLSSLKLVRIIIRPEDEKSLKAFEEYKSSCGKNRQPSRLSEISSRQSCQVESVFTESGGAYYTTTIDHVTLSIDQGDLTTATTAVIVNSVPDDLNMESGNISRALLKAAGKSIQLEANKNKKSFKQSGLIMTTSGRLLCQKIIHVKARNGLTGWKKTIAKCLAEVEKSCLNSVSFPALGTGGKGFPPVDIARTMAEAFQEYILGESYQGYLRNVKILVYETEMVELFTKGVKDTIESSPRKSIFQELKFWERKPTDETECSRMVFHIYTESPSGDTNIVRRIEDLHKEVDISVPEDVRF